jgi:hypothetical protein
MEPVEIHEFFRAVFAGAMVLMAGAGYAVLFGFARVYKLPALMPLAYLSYALLAFAVFTVTDALHFTGLWQVISATMLIGYLVGPHVIWHLCLALHGSPDAAGGEE